MNLCIICATQLQLFNMIVYVDNYVDRKKYERIDLYTFYDNGIPRITEDTIYRLQKIGIFTKTYSFDLTDKIIPGISGKLVGKYRNITSYIYYNRFVRKRIKLPDVRYDVICCGMEYRIVKLMQMLNPDAKLHIVEEGRAVYTDEVIIKNSFWDRISFHILRLKEPKIVPDAVFAYDVGSLQHTYAYDRKKLIFNSGEIGRPEILKQLKNIFGYKLEEEYQSRRLVYLSCVEVREQWRIRNKEIADCLYKYDNEIVVRKHPLQMETEPIEKFSVDSVNMWELLVGDVINDNHILIANFSSAQLTPKMMFDKEPYLIFLHRLYDYGEEMELVEAVIKELTNKYLKKEKIFIIERMEQIYGVIDNILGNGKQ